MVSMVRLVSACHNLPRKFGLDPSHDLGHGDLGWTRVATSKEPR
jgi:hypothetical protein